MSGNADIIQEFLVSLGFKLNQADLNKFDGALKSVTKNIVKFGGAALTMATAATAFVANVADELEDLYWSSVRLRDGVANIKDFQLGLSKLGGTAEGAANALENMATYLRTNPAAEGWLHNLGVATRDIDNNLRGTIDIVRDFAHLPIPYWLKVRFAQRFGIDEKTLQALVREAPKAEHAVSDLYKNAGISADDAAKKSMEFNNALRDLEASLGVVGTVLEVHLLPFVRGLVAVLGWLLTALVWLEKHTDGWSTALLVVVAIAGAIALAFGFIPALIALVAGLAITIIGNFDKIKGYVNSWLEWVRAKYNAAAKFLGLPQWGGVGKVKDSPGGFGGPDYQKLERNFGSKSVGGANDNTGDTSNLSGRALAFFQKVGWTADQAAGIVANLVHESGLNTKAVGDHGKAFGIAQWHEDRQKAFADWAGHDIKQSTLEEQLAFVNHELVKGSEQFAGKMLKASKGAADAGARVSKFYERPANQVGEMVARSKTADALVNGSKLAPSSSSSHSVIINQKTDIKVSGSDPDSTARAVGRDQQRVNGDLVRNFAGATS